MTDILIAAMAIATVVLGALAYTKLRRATGVTPEQDKLSKMKASKMPRELRELQIEQPDENMLDHPEQQKRNSWGEQGISGRSPS